jgi:hypothetical protein
MALKRVRDKSENGIAVIGLVRALEQIDDQAHAPGRRGAFSNSLADRWPLVPQKRRESGHARRSEKGQLRTHAPQQTHAQLHGYSITSLGTSEQRRRDFEAELTFSTRRAVKRRYPRHTGNQRIAAACSEAAAVRGRATEAWPFTG